MVRNLVYNLTWIIEFSRLFRDQNTLGVFFVFDYGHPVRLCNHSAIHSCRVRPRPIIVVLACRRVKKIDRGYRRKTKRVLTR